MRQVVHYAKFEPEGCAPSQEVLSAEPEALQNVVWPEAAVAFTLFARADEVIGGEVWRGLAKRINSVRYYHPDSTVLSLAEVRQRPASGYLVANMERNELSHVVYTRFGDDPQPFFPEHMVVMKHRPTGEAASLQGVALRDVRDMPARQAQGQLDTGTDGDWLWGQFMQWCRARGVAPANYGDLFAIVGRARERAAGLALQASTPTFTREEVWVALGGDPAEVPERSEVLAALQRLGQGTTERGQEDEAVPVSKRARERA